MSIVLFGLFGLACIEAKEEEEEEEEEEEICMSSADCDVDQYCSQEACLDKADFGEECTTSDSCVAEAFCLKTASSADAGQCYRIPDECSYRIGCDCHQEGVESPLCETALACEDSEDLESYLLTCDNDSSPGELEGSWLDNGRISNGPQCSMRAYVVPESGDPPEGCPSCDIVFNARFEFYYDTCGFLSDSALSNGVYYPFGLSADRMYYYQNGSWEEYTTSSQPERGWRSYSLGRSYWEDIGNVSYLHSISFNITW